jgi:RNA polymerase sigma factor (sigma-70 family)
MDDDPQVENPLHQYEGLAASIIRSHYPAGERGPEWEDLLQEARLGLCEAAAAYDDRPDGNNNGNGFALFSTYAFPWIIGRVKKAVALIRAHQLNERTDLYQVQDPSQNTFDTGRFEAMWTAFEQLPSIEQDVLIYRYGLRGKRQRTQQETSAQLNISVSTVKRTEKSAIEGLEVRLRIFPDDYPV